MSERNKEYDEILEKFGARAGFNGVGWGGCTCPCHKGLAIHIQACCHPSREELKKILDVLAEDDMAQKLVGAALATVIGGSTGSFSRVANEVHSRIDDIKRDGGGFFRGGGGFPF